MKTTFAKIKEHHPCTTWWIKLIDYWNPSDLNETITIKQIIESNGIKNALWATRSLYLKTDIRKLYKLKAEIALLVLSIFENKYPEDKRPRNTIKVAIKYSQYKTTKEELNTAAFNAAHVAAAIYIDAAAYAAAYAANAAANAAADTAAYAAAAYAANAAAANAAAANAAYTAYAATHTSYSAVYAAGAANADMAAYVAATDAFKQTWKQIEKITLKY